MLWLVVIWCLLSFLPSGYLANRHYSRQSPLLMCLVAVSLSFSFHIGRVNTCLAPELKSLPFSNNPTTNMYKVLANQYDPLCFISTFTAQGKVLLQRLWMNNRVGWPNPPQRALSIRPGLREKVSSLTWSRSRFPDTIAQVNIPESLSRVACVQWCFRAGLWVCGITQDWNPVGTSPHLLCHGKLKTSS